MLRSYFDGVVPEPTFEGAESDLPQVIAEAVRRYDEEMLAVRPTAALAAVYDVVVRANRYMVERSPWTLAKDAGEAGGARLDPLRLGGDPARAHDPDLVRHAERRRRVCGSSSASRKPSSAQRLAHAGAWGRMAPGTRTTKGESLFPRVDADD